MTDPVSREEIKAQLDAVEARVDVRFERVLREIEKSGADIKSRVDVAAAKSLDKWTAFTLAIAMVALIYAMLAYGGSLFGLGLSTKDIAEAAAKAAVAAKK